MRITFSLGLLLLSALMTLSTRAGDIEAGKVVSAACTACHGAQGLSSSTEWPNLAGQNFIYLVNQITAFREGDRVNALMAPMVSGLSDEDIENLANYYSSIEIPFPAVPAADATGRNQVATCVACHGTLGHPVTDVWPILSGQQSAYLANQLKAFRDGGRKHLLMQQMATPLSDEDIEAIATFYENLK